MVFNWLIMFFVVCVKRKLFLWVMGLVFRVCFCIRLWLNILGVGGI